MIENFRKNVVLNRYTFRLLYKKAHPRELSVAAESQDSAVLMIKSDAEYMHEDFNYPLPTKCLLLKVEPIET